MRMKSLSMLFVAVCGSCAAPMPTWDSTDPASEPAARALLERSVRAVEGPQPVQEIEAHYTGKWGFWVRQIQPEITDARFRQTAVDVLRPGEDWIEQRHTGPGGQKLVRWDGQEIQVTYPEGREGTAQEKQAAALVAEAYQLFLLGPRYIKTHAKGVRSLPDRREKGRLYQRLIASLRPGLGFSEQDFVVLWIDAETGMPFRVHFTLEGFESTRGAHADTTYLSWVRINGHAFPVENIERVRGPLRLHAHTWRAVELSVR